MFKPIYRFALVLSGPTLLAAPAFAQVPDLLNALDAGGRAMATGGANESTNIDTLSAYYNPAALGYLDTKAVDLVYRNLPKSTTSLSGSRNDPSEDSTGRTGDRAFTHAGFAVPVRELFGRGSGTIGVAYTIGGYIDDHATAGFLTDGALSVQNYDLRREAQASFYSLSYGKAVNSGLSFGLGLVVASQQVRYSETGTEVDNGTSAFDLDARGSSTGSGVGAIVGALYTPPSANAWTFGLSYRTPIDLNGNGNTSSEYDRIPGRLIFGTTWRKDGFRDGKDYLLVGAQLQEFFSGDDSEFFDRNSQSVFGFGTEYNLGIASGRVPLRVGFSTVPSGGYGYGSRNAFTFGFGYRPNRLPVGLDLSFAVPEHGGTDFSVAASYRFK